MAGQFEDALARTERDARATQRAAETAVKASKRLAAAAASGDVGALEKAVSETEQAVRDLAMQMNNTRDGWTFDAQTYAERGGLKDELAEAARAEGLSIFEQDGRLFCYPALVRIIPAEPAVDIDRKRFRSVRPTYVARQLKALRTRPQRFRPEQFLDLLFRTYQIARKAEHEGTRRLGGQGPVSELVSLFELLTLFPDARKSYDRAEFVRDVYLLDRSGVRVTRNGDLLELSASTGTKGSTSRLLQIVDENGRPRDYFGISFSGSSR